MDPLSCPFVIHRSYSPYYERSVNLASTGNELLLKAQRESEYLKRYLSCDIPGALLKRCILEDAVANRNRNLDLIHKSLNSVLCVEHDSHPLVIYASGHAFEQLTIRPVDRSLRSIMKTYPAFSINNKVSVENLFRAGTSLWNPASHILAQSEYELNYYRTVDIKEHISATHRQFYPFSLILDHIQRFVLPEKIEAACSSPANIECRVLSKSGHMYRWNTEIGLELFSTTPLFQPEEMLHNEDRQSCHIECGSHPRVSYFTHGTQLCVHDMRSSTTSRILSAAYSISSVKQSVDQGNHVFISHRALVGCVDVRHSNSFLLLKPLPMQHNTLGQSIPYDRSDKEIFIGFSPHSRQIMTHSFSYSDQLSLKSFPEGPLALGNIAAASGNVIINHCHPHVSLIHLSMCAKHVVSWEVDGFPVVDRASLGEYLVGAAVIPNVDFDDNELCMGEKDACQESMEASRKPKSYEKSYLLVQQSSSGSVYAQTIRLIADSSERSAPAQTKLPVGVRCSLPGLVNIEIKKYKEVSSKRGLRTINLLAGDAENMGYAAHSSAYLPYVNPNSIIRHNIVRKPLNYFKKINLSASSFGRRHFLSLNSKAKSFKKSSSKSKLRKSLTQRSRSDSSTLSEMSMEHDMHNSFHQFFPLLKSKLKSMKFSLWHIFQLLKNQMKSDVDIRELRRLLLEQESIVETVLVDPSACLSSSDGLYIRPWKPDLNCIIENCSCVSNGRFDAQPFTCYNQNCLVPHVLLYGLVSNNQDILIENCGESEADVSYLLISSLKLRWN